MFPSPTPGQTPVYEDYARCIHCGLCLNACPTYRLWNLEADSPRGRIQQMVHVELHQQPITDSFVDHIDKCLDCRACETACPSGVEYGKLVEHARARIERDYPRSWLASVARKFVFRHLLPDPHRIIDAARVLRFYQRSGLQAIARGIGVLKLLGLAESERLPPPVRAAPASPSSPAASPTSLFRSSTKPPSASLPPTAAKSSSPMASSAAARSRRTPAFATPPANSREKISPYFFAKSSTPSLPTPPAAAPRSRNTIIFFHQTNPNTPRPARSRQELATSPNSLPLSVSPQD